MDRVFDEAVPSQAANESAVAAVLEGVEDSGLGEEGRENNFVSAKLLNNAAALHLRGGDKAAAIQLMYEAIEVSQAQSFKVCSYTIYSSKIYGDNVYIHEMFGSIQL